MGGFGQVPFFLHSHCCLQATNLFIILGDCGTAKFRDPLPKTFFYQIFILTPAPLPTYYHCKTCTRLWTYPSHSTIVHTPSFTAILWTVYWAASSLLFHCDCGSSIVHWSFVWSAHDMVKLQKPELHIGYRLQISSTRIVLHFMGLCVHACMHTCRNLILFMHSIINRVTAWFRIFLGLPSVIHQVAKFCAGLDLRDPSLWSGKPTARPYPEPAESSLHLWNQFLYSQFQ
jgi:hypothetical protein